MRIFESIDVDFVGRRKMGYVISGILIIISAISLATFGLKLGIDFQSGTEFVIETDTPVSSTELKSLLSETMESEPEIKTYGGDNALLVRTTEGGDIEVVQNSITSTMSSNFEGSNPSVVKREAVSARFADDMKNGAILAIIISLLVIFGYILIRFEWRFGVGAVAALAHDVFITLGLFALLHNFVPFSLEINQSIIGALLTIVGYSLNDTVVVFDRIREYTRVFKTQAYDKMVNRSINSTLSRTLVTSGTTLIVVMVLFFAGGEVLRGFAFALIVGILVGTYSSIFVASPTVVELKGLAARNKN